MKDDKKEGLPPALVEALQEGTELLRHNWMYSFMPLRDTYIYLVGYCKQCDQSVSSRVDTDFNIRTGSSRETVLTKAGIPKWGCVPVE